MINISYRRVGGLRILKIGRLCLSWCVSSSYRPIKGTAAHRKELKAQYAQPSGEFIYATH